MCELVLLPKAVDLSRTEVLMKRSTNFIIFPQSGRRLLVAVPGAAAQSWRTGHDNTGKKTKWYENGNFTIATKSRRSWLWAIPTSNRLLPVGRNDAALSEVFWTNLIAITRFSVLIGNGDLVHARSRYNYHMAIITWDISPLSISAGYIFIHSNQNDAKLGFVTFKMSHIVSRLN